MSNQQSDETDVSPITTPTLDSWSEFEQLMQSVVLTAAQNDIPVSGGIEVQRGDDRWNIEITKLE